MVKPKHRQPFKKTPIGSNPFIKSKTPKGFTPHQTLEQALALHQQGLTNEAENLYRLVLKDDPDNFNALHLLGVTLSEQAKYQDAIEYITRALQFGKNSHLVYSNLGVAYRGIGQETLALEAFNKALLLNPVYAPALSNRGLCYNQLGESTKALEDLKTAIDLYPPYFYAHNNLGLVYKALHDWPAALKCYERAIKLNPNYAEAHWNKSLLHLLLGDYFQGFREYEWRWRNKSSPVHLEHRTYPRPLWLGIDDVLTSKPRSASTIFVYSEQGLGDTLQFCRYLAYLRREFKSVVFQCPPTLNSLITHSMPGVHVIDSAQNPPDFDCYTPLLSLPLALMQAQTEKQPSANQPVPAPDLDFYPHSYLSVPNASYTHWSKLLSDQIKVPASLRVGVLCRGNPNHPNDQQRSVALKDLLSVLPKALNYINLQKDIYPEDQALMENHSHVFSFANDVNDFLDTAALCQNLDLIITVDTSVAHLCGALGLSTWLLLPHTPDWRWLVDRSDSPWYPSMRVFRQSAQRDWGEVLCRVAGELEHLGKGS